MKSAETQINTFPTNGLRPEAELVLLCARTRMDGERTERIRRLLSENLDWNYLLNLAKRHGLLPLLYWNLKNFGPETVPAERLAYLQARFRVNATRNLVLTNELLRLLKLFGDADITALPYKGPVLAAAVYGDVALRQFTDLDILVRGQDSPKCRELMRAQGYRQEGHPEYAEEFVSADGSVGVEIHSQLTGFAFAWQGTTDYHAFPMDYESLQDRFDSVSLAGVPVSNLSPEDSLLFLCVHGSKHLWERIGWICDVAQLMQAQPNLDWNRVMERSQTLGCERMLLLGFYLVRELLGGNLPEPILARTRKDRAVAALAAQVACRLFLEAEPTPQKMEDALFALRLRNRWRDKLPCCLHYARLTFVPTERDRDAAPLPAFLRGFHYVIRPVRLIGQSLMRRLLPNRR